MNEETFTCNGCSNSVKLIGPVDTVEAECGRCGYRMTPDE